MLFNCQYDVASSQISLLASDNHQLLTRLGNMRLKIAELCAMYLFPRILKTFLRIKFNKWVTFARTCSAQLDKQMLDEAWSKAHRMAVSVKKTKDHASILVSVNAFNIVIHCLIVVLFCCI